MSLAAILILNLFSSFFLCGLIWTVQLVHYPMFHSLEKESFVSHMNLHKSRISLIVVPVMLAELGSSAWLALFADSIRGYHIAGFIIILLIWIVTFLMQVPQHNRLSDGKDEEVIRKLVSGNWIRTALWSAKSILGILILLELL